jgi:hypothetical protein
MKSKLCNVLILSVVLLLTFLPAQKAPAQNTEVTSDSLNEGSAERPTPFSRGSLSFGGSIEYSNTVPDVGESASTFAFGGNAHLFVVPRFSIGADISSTNMSVGSTSITTTEVGPAIRFMFGSPASKDFPYLHVGFRSLNSSISYQWGTFKVSGNSFRTGIGFLFRRWAHVGMSLELAANFRKINNTHTTIFGITLGLSGLVYGLF